MRHHFSLSAKNLRGCCNNNTNNGGFPVRARDKGVKDVLRTNLATYDIYHSDLGSHTGNAWNSLRSIH